jgi:predicted homoserine dehydrogenase-like protein
MYNNNSPEADLATISKIFAVIGDGGITEFPGAVDIVQGSAMADGVFVPVRVDDERIREDLQF